MNNEIIILSTVPDIKEGETLASILVEGNFAACVNIIPKITSIYQWNDKVHRDSEVLLLIKTNNINESQVYNIIKDKHSYDTPEIITLDLKNIDKKYAKWLNSTVNEKT